VIGVEVCINADGDQSVTDAVNAALAGRAATIELCGAMDVDGLTPDMERVQEARKAWDRKGLMVMIRPRPGDFVYTGDEVALMRTHIRAAVAAGADGVVFGALRADGGGLDRDGLRNLLDLARQYGVQTTVHRAFDAAPDPLRSLDWTREVGFDRVLTSGMPWGSGRSAVDGIGMLRRLIARAAGEIEIVIGGGVNPGNARRIVAEIPAGCERVSVHAYSGVQDQGRVTSERVKSLWEAVNGAQL
jgi:copper homeostasis protein